MTYANNKFSTVITSRLLSVSWPSWPITRSVNKEAAATIFAEYVRKKKEGIWAHHLLGSHTDSLYCELAPAHVEKVL